MINDSPTLYVRACVFAYIARSHTQHTPKQDQCDESQMSFSTNYIQHKAIARRATRGTDSAVAGRLAQRYYHLPWVPTDRYRIGFDHNTTTAIQNIRVAHPNRWYRWAGWQVCAFVMCACVFGYEANHAAKYGAVLR